jgi:hypothetical protein
MVFIGILLATVCNFTLGFLGYTIAINSVFLVNTFQLVGSEITRTEYIYSFFLKFLVIFVLTWILNKVMPLLDKPRKRILFIYLVGTIFAIYNQIDVFWSSLEDVTWSLILIGAESLNWLATGFVLSRFIKPKHLGAL